MLHPYAIALVLFQAVLGQDVAKGSLGPLQVAGVAAGVGILAVGGGAVVLYGAYAHFGRNHAVTEALGDIPRRVKETVAPSTPDAPAQAAPATGTPAPAPDAPAAETPATDAPPPASSPDAPPAAAAPVAPPPG
jgi:hypothetical protein